MFADEVVDDFFGVGDAFDAGHDFPDFFEVGFGGVGDGDFVADAAEEGFINEVFGVEVGGEDDELVEGDFDFDAGVEGEEVDAFFEGDDPAVEEFFGVHALAAEVIDHEGAAVGFHLERGFVVAGFGVPDEVEGGHGEFAADDDDGAFDEDPALVVFLFEANVFTGGDGAVVEFVVEADDGAVDLDAVGDEDVAAEGLDDAFGDGGFAVAGGSVEEDGLAGVGGGADLGEDGFVEDEAFEGGGEAFLVDLDVADGLGTDGADVAGEGDGSGTDVGGLFDEELGAFASGAGDGVEVGNGLEVTAGDFDEAGFAEHVEDWLDHVEKREANFGGDVAGDHGITCGEEFEDESFDDQGVNVKVMVAGGLWYGEEGSSGEDVGFHEGGGYLGVGVEGSGSFFSEAGEGVGATWLSCDGHTFVAKWWEVCGVDYGVDPFP